MAHRRRSFAALVLLAPATLEAQDASPPGGSARDSTLVGITGVTVIDVAGGRRLAAQTVVVRGARIAVAGAAARVALPAGARVIDGRGRFLIPGLWDMHVHLFRNRMDAVGENTDDSEVFFPAFVANGVIGVRDMSTDLADHAQIRRWAVARAAGTLVGPRIIGGSPLLGGQPPIQPNALVLPTAANARRVVDSLIDGGVGYLKVYSGLTREVYFAIAEQAKRRGVPFAGHVPSVVTHAEASDAGQRTFEHLNDAPRNCSAELRELETAAQNRESIISPDSAAARARAATLAALARFDVRSCTPLFERFVRNRTWQVPTLTISRTRYARADSATRADPRLRFVSPQLMQEWRVTSPTFAQAMIPQERALQLERYRVRQRIVGAMHAAGVPLLAGTDVHNPYIYPGFSLHDELEMLVESGLPPLAALRAATIDPVRYFGATDSLGAIAPGKIADLVLLDADPLVDIRNAKKIRAVVLNGRVLDRPALDALLAAAERAAAPGSMKR